MDKSLEILLHFWDVFRFTQVQPLPSRHKQCWTRVSRIFFEFQLCIGVGGGRSARKFRNWCTVLRGNGEITEKYAYCSRVPRTFVQDCLNPGFGGKSMFSSFFLRFLGILETCRWWPLILFSQHSKFVQVNSLVSHIGPTPLNWSRVQRKLVRHDVLSVVHSTR